MKKFRNWIPTAVVAIAIMLVLHYTGVLNSMTTVGVVVITFSVVLFLSVLLSPPHEKE
jgi:hypothetical protein